MKLSKIINTITLVYNLVLSSFMTYHRVCNKSNTTGGTCVAGTAYPSGTPELTTVFVGFVLLGRLFFLCNVL